MNYIATQLSWSAPEIVLTDTVYSNPPRNYCARNGAEVGVSEIAPRSFTYTCFEEGVELECVNR